MQKIRQEMEKAQDSREDVETIFEKLKKFDVPIV